MTRRPNTSCAFARRFHLFSNGFTLYIRLLRHLHQRGLEGEASCTEAMASIRGVVFDSTPAWGPPPAVIPPPQVVKLVATQAVAGMLKKENFPGMTMRDIAPRSPLKAIVESACERSQDSVFDSTWHYSWAREHEPAVPSLFVYSAVDRTTRQEAIEQWLGGNEEAWAASGRRVRRLLLPNTGHCMHWWRAGPQYKAALQELIDGLAA